MNKNTTLLLFAFLLIVFIALVRYDDDDDDQARLVVVEQAQKHAKKRSRWVGCINVNASRDPIACVNRTRFNILDSEPLCYASVLDMALDDTVAVLERLNKTLILAYGTLLGAVRTQDIFSWTNDVDVHYLSEQAMTHRFWRQQVEPLLRERGYTLIRSYGRWRVCVSRAHRYAERLASRGEIAVAKSTDSMARGNRSGGVVRAPIEFSVPFVDVFAMRGYTRRQLKTQVTSSGVKSSMKINVDYLHVVDCNREHWNERCLMPRDSVLPLRAVTINNRSYWAPNEVEHYLRLEYGSRWRRPDQHFRKPSRAQLASGLARHRRRRATMTRTKSKKPKT
jgi:LicD family